MLSIRSIGNPGARGGGRPARLAAVGACLVAFAVPAGAATRAGPAGPTASPVAGRVAGPVDLCDGSTAAHVGRLRVTRSRPLNPERFNLPALAASARVPALRALAAVLCALPRVGRGVFSCPIDLGVTYTLQFSLAPDPSRGVPAVRPVSYDATGCQFVTGAGTPRRASPAFTDALGVALGLPHASPATFAGTLLD
ncbi:MAG: hypothetical protein ACP5OV_04650 [Acidimicrobiales bacterium]